MQRIVKGIVLVVSFFVVFLGFIMQRYATSVQGRWRSKRIYTIQMYRQFLFMAMKEIPFRLDRFCEDLKGRISLSVK